MYVPKAFKRQQFHSQSENLICQKQSLGFVNAYKNCMQRKNGYIIGRILYYLVEHDRGRSSILDSLWGRIFATLPPHPNSQFLFKSVPKHVDPLLGLLFFLHKRSQNVKIFTDIWSVYTSTIFQTWQLSFPLMRFPSILPIQLVSNRDK